MALRNKEEYISAARFLRNPQEEGIRRKDRAMEMERKAAQERVAREERRKEAVQELAVAMDRSDEDAVRALLVEDVLPKLDAEAADAFLAALVARRGAVRVLLRPIEQARLLQCRSRDE